MLYIIGLGPGDADGLTLGAIEQLSRKDARIILRTGRHGAADWLRQNSISFETFDALYSEVEDFDELDSRIADELSKCDGTIVYGVPGSADISDSSVRRLAMNGVQMKVIPGVSLTSEAEAGALSGGMQPIGNGRCASVPASEISSFEPDVKTLLVVTELNDRLTLSDVKLRLLEFYPDEHNVFLVSAGKAVATPLYAVDRDREVDHRSALSVPGISSLLSLERFGINELNEVMRILRSPDGCPWDAAQTHSSIAQYIIEEAYEAASAIKNEDVPAMTEELGDLLLQIIFHASLSEDTGDMNMRDITTEVCRKMINRHPHVFFRDDKEKNSKNWETIKKEEKGFSTLADELGDVPVSMPSLLRSEKLQKKASRSLGILADAEASRRLALDALSKGDQPLALFYLANLMRTEGRSAEHELADLADSFESQACDATAGANDDAIYQALSERNTRDI